MVGMQSTFQPLRRRATKKREHKEIDDAHTHKTGRSVGRRARTQYDDNAIWFIVDAHKYAINLVRIVYSSSDGCT